MIKIRFFCDFASNEVLISDVITVSKLKDDKNFNVLYSFTHGNDYTHAILINTVTPHLNIPKKNVIGIAWEPIPFLKLNLQFIQYAKQHIGKYLIGDSVNMGQPFIETFAHILHSPDIPTQISLVGSKTKKMSIMISNKYFAPGHEYRHKLVQQILNSDLDIDIYGRGCQLYSQNHIMDRRFKGPFQNSREMLEHYEYHICIENFQSEHYFSEKIIDPLLCNTVPIYLGCKNILQYFPSNNIIHLSGNINQDMALIRQLYQSPRTITIDTNKIHERVSFKNVINHFLQ